MLQDPRWQIKHDARQILNDAAQYLETHGWCQGAMQYRNKVCLYGAINAANKCGYVEAEIEVNHMLRAVTGTFSIVGWNDAPGRTKQQVIKVLRAAANAS